MAFSVECILFNRRDTRRRLGEALSSTRMTIKEDRKLRARAEQKRKRMIIRRSKEEDDILGVELLDKYTSLVSGEPLL